MLGDSLQKEYPDGTIAVITSSQPYRMVELRNCLCEDKVRRTIKITGRFVSNHYIKGSTKVRNKTVSGAVFFTTDIHVFKADCFCKNWREIKSDKVKVFDILDAAGIELIKICFYNLHLKDKKIMRSSNIIRSWLGLLDIAPVTVNRYFQEWKNYATNLAKLNRNR